MFLNSKIQKSILCLIKEEALNNIMNMIDIMGKKKIEMGVCVGENQYTPQGAGS